MVGRVGGWFHHIRDEFARNLQPSSYEFLFLFRDGLANGSKQLAKKAPKSRQHFSRPNYGLGQGYNGDYKTDFFPLKEVLFGEKNFYNIVYVLLDFQVNLLNPFI